MRANRIRTRWAAGKTVLNGWMTIPSSWTAELMASYGFDSLTIDMQHGLMDYQTALHMLQAIATTDTAPVVRVPWNEPSIIMKMLDAGAMAIICPLVNTAEEVEAFVSSCRYPPRGKRSFGPTRATLYGSDYVAKADETIVTIAMVETRQALENIEAIVSVPGLDAIYVGPSDLRLDMGLGLGVDLDDPRFVAALDKVQDACARHGVALGLHSNTVENVRMMMARQPQFLTVLSDGRFLTMGAQIALQEVKALR